MRGGVHARGDSAGGGVEVHVRAQTQGHAAVQSLRLPQVDRHGLVSGEAGPRATVNHSADSNEYLLCRWFFFRSHAPEEMVGKLYISSCVFGLTSTNFF